MCRRLLIADRKSKVKEHQARVLSATKLALMAADDDPEAIATSLQAILKAAPETIVAGIGTVARAVIQSEAAAEGPGAAFCGIYMHVLIGSGCVDTCCRT